jgi:hypothetical protein
VRYLASGLAALLIVLSASAALSNGDMIYVLRDTRETLADVVSLLNAKVSGIRGHFSACQCWRGKAYKVERRELNTHTTSTFALSRCYDWIDEAGRAENDGDARRYNRSMRKLRNVYRVALKKLRRSYERYATDDCWKKWEFGNAINEAWEAFEDAFGYGAGVRGFPLELPDCPPVFIGPGQDQF